MSRPSVSSFPSVSVNVGLSMPYARKTPPLRLERRHGEREVEPGTATHACPHCGGRAPDGLGHPRGPDGTPVCLAMKIKMRGLW